MLYEDSLDFLNYYNIHQSFSLNLVLEETET
jgi:hypothetical protein